MIRPADERPAANVCGIAGDRRASARRRARISWRVVGLRGARISSQRSQVYRCSSLLHSTLINVVTLPLPGLTLETSRQPVAYTC